VADAVPDSLPLRYRIPNALTLARLVALPFFWILLAGAADGHSVVAGILFAAASLTDWFDGYLARRLDYSTRFGRMADPLADRLLIDSAVLLLWWHDRLPLLVPLLILSRDVVLLIAQRAAAARGYELTVIYLGKAATAILMVGLGLIMVTSQTAHWPTYVVEVGLGLSLLAGALYLGTVRSRLRIEVNKGT
jgi:CDP-diacylglycerol--glycerol-3-phosphate 3-phosphatidyltransferase